MATAKKSTATGQSSPARKRTQGRRDGGVITFAAKLERPAPTGKPAPWTFLRLPTAASGALPSRGHVCIEGTLNGTKFAITLEPDGQGGHWLKVPRKLMMLAGVEAGDVVALEIAVSERVPEPTVPADLRKALAADEKAKHAWKGITPAARRDFVHWIVSPKQAETRARRIVTACDMLVKGKRRPCCFDRSGMYSGSLACPVADES